MNFYLEHILTGDKMYLIRGDNTLGRNASCTWIMNYEYVSRFHAVMVVKRKTLFIKELDARNGVFLNYSRIGSELHEVFVGDDISFGVEIDPMVEQELPITFGIFTVKAEPAPLAILDLKKRNNGDRAPPTNNPPIKVVAQPPNTATNPKSNPNPSKIGNTVACY
ncbi:uncharacterized protein [Drosophila bipectinata]|uniref:uncharacterized protein n=1 Tax=Drosophila bipectinata TaxID=42026 RepID=UPI001C8A6B6E|nr:uncharacterized protein LOC108120169 [Drosophila bipectinata]